MGRCKDKWTDHTADDALRLQAQGLINFIYQATSQMGNKLRVGNYRDVYHRLMPAVQAMHPN
jgi:hypothetical protein